MTFGDCRICATLFDDSVPDDKVRHEAFHAQLANGVMPQDARELLKTYGHSVARNSGLEHLRYKHRDTGVRAVCYAWWSRALQSGAPPTVACFEQYMRDHFAFIDADIAGTEISPELARAMNEWKSFGG